MVNFSSLSRFSRGAEDFWADQADVMAAALAKDGWDGLCFAQAGGLTQDRQTPAPDMGRTGRLACGGNHSMRIILAAIILCAFGLAGASAGSSNSKMSGAKAKRESAAHASKSSRSSKSHGRNLGGIHPLVGSGDY
ncbi:MAG TPA: hypothetical protein VMU18_06215 [Rhodoblastus sp.]|nr:hypothetical protein [Rhodoblastus sp.]